MKSSRLMFSMSALLCAFCGASCSAEPTPIASPTTVSSSMAADDENGSPLDGLEFTDCPEADWVFRLEYEHNIVLKQANMVEITMDAEKGAAFYLSIYANGVIDGDHFENRIPISIHGTVGDCIIDGENMLHADILGACVDGIATIDILESFDQGYSFLETCPEGGFLQSVDRMVSAPEVRYEFELKKGGDSKVIDTDLGNVSIHYSWTLQPDSLAPVPLPTPDQD